MIHIRSFVIYTLLCFALSPLLPTPLLAQECGIEKETITRLKRPDFTSLRAWDIIKGEDGYDRFRDVVMVDNQTAVLVGDYTVDEDDTTYKPFIMKLTKRNDVLWDNRELLKADHRPVRVMAAEDGGYVVVGDKKVGARTALYFARYSADGELIARHAIEDKSGDLRVAAIDRLAGSTGYILAAQYTHNTDAEKSHGVIFKVSQKGEVVWRRGYKPGNATVFHDVHTNDDGSYMVSGKIRLDDGRMAGWAVKLNEKGAIDWQQTYPRGRNAALLRANSFRDGGFVFTGDVEPSGGGRKSAWVMAVNQSGDVIWQRYFTADYNYSGHDVVFHEDGRVDALISGTPLSGRRSTPHVRVLTLSPRGFLMGVSDHTNGQGAGARRMVLGDDQQRIFVGAAQTRAPANVPLGALPPHTFDAWIVGLPPLEVYNDPCLVNPLDDIRPIDNSPF